MEPVLEIEGQDRADLPACSPRYGWQRVPGPVRASLCPGRHRGTYDHRYRSVFGANPAEESATDGRWSGSVTTLPYLSILGPALRRLRERREFELLVIGGDLRFDGVPTRCKP